MIQDFFRKFIQVFRDTLFQDSAFRAGENGQNILIYFKLEDEYALMDMEAGIEHFVRGIDNGVDQILMVVEPSYESLALTGKILELGQSIGKPVCFVLNKVDEENQEGMKDNVCEGAEVVCALPPEKKISAAGLKGEELREQYLHQNPNDRCIVGRNIKPVLTDMFMEMEKAIVHALSGKTLADCIGSIKKRLDAEGNGRQRE